LDCSIQIVLSTVCKFILIHINFKAVAKVRKFSHIFSFLKINLHVHCGGPLQYLIPVTMLWMLLQEFNKDIHW